MKFSVVLIALTLLNLRYGQEVGYYTSELVTSIQGNLSFEKRGSPDYFPLTGYCDVMSDTISSDSLLVRINFAEIEDTTSSYHLGTLRLYKKHRGDDRRRDVYMYSNYIMKISNEAKSSKWVKVHKDGGLIITRNTKCGLAEEVGYFFTSE